MEKLGNVLHYEFTSDDGAYPFEAKGDINIGEAGLSALRVKELFTEQMDDLPYNLHKFLANLNQNEVNFIVDPSRDKPVKINKSTSVYFHIKDVAYWKLCRTRLTILPGYEDKKPFYVETTSIIGDDYGKSLDNLFLDIKRLLGYYMQDLSGFNEEKFTRLVDFKELFLHSSELVFSYRSRSFYKAENTIRLEIFEDDGTTGGVND